MLSICVTSPIRKSGKTFVTTGLAATMQSLGYSTSVYKPIQTAGIEINGFTQSPDITYIKTIDPYINTNYTHLFKYDTEPLLAAEAENEMIDVDLILHDYKKINSSSDCTIVDSDGGIFSPITANVLNADLINKLQIPVIIVIKPNMDSINTTLSTIYSALEKDIKIRGVIINNISEDCSKYLLTGISRVIEEYSNVKILGLVPKIENINSPEDLITAHLNGIDIESIFGIKIEKLDLN